MKRPPPTFDEAFLFYWTLNLNIFFSILDIFLYCSYREPPPGTHNDAACSVSIVSSSVSCLVLSKEQRVSGYA